MDAGSGKKLSLLEIIGLVIESREPLIQVVKTFKADEGLKQNIEKLEVYLQNQAALKR